MKKRVWLFCYLCLFLDAGAYAEIATDGSTGTQAAQVLSPSIADGNSFAIPQSLGTTAGNNLFHSFSTFNLNSNESATFTGSDALKNVINRVTGGSPSSIDGLLKSTIGKANFYFINPAGVTFGANAKVDVPAAFYLSSADNLHFTDGKDFSTASSTASNLSVADPVSFGFLGTANSAISFDGTTITSKPAQDFTIVAGNISLLNKASITAEAGSIQLTAVGKNTATVAMNGVADVANGSIAIDSGTLDVSGNGSGKLTIQGGDVTVNHHSQLFANNTGSQDAEDKYGIHISATNLTVDSSQIGAESDGAGNAGVVSIKTDSLNVSNSASISSDALSTGDAGKVFIDSNIINISHNAWISSDTFSYGNGGSINIKSNALNMSRHGSIFSDANFESFGNAGSITIDSDNIFIENGSIESNAGVSSTGNAGNIVITGNSLSLLNSSGITTSTRSSGNAGHIDIHVNDISVSGIPQSIPKLFLTGIASDTLNTEIANPGNGGTISITGNRLNLLSGGRISSGTDNIGNAGDIKINVGEVVVDGQSNRLAIISTSKLNITSDNTTTTAGNAGNISIKGNSLSLLNGGIITSSTLNSGNGGNISIEENDILINGQSLLTGIGAIHSGALIGNPGSIDIKANNLNMIDGGLFTISSTPALSNMSLEQFLSLGSTLSLSEFVTLLTTTSSTTAPVNLSISNPVSSLSPSNINTGLIQLNIANQLTMQNDALINSSTAGQGNAGDINIAASNIHLDNASISAVAQKSAEGNAGTITINSDSLTILNGGSVRSDTYSQGNAGVINIQNTGKILLDRQNSTVDTGISTDTYASDKTGGTAGNIHIKTGQLAVLNGGEISSNTDTEGRAGDVVVDANDILIDGHGDALYTAISTDASALSTGNAGTVTVTSSNVTILDGGTISSSSHGHAHGNAGEVHVTADKIMIDGRGNPLYTGIFSDSYASLDANGVNLNQGHADKVSIKTNALSLVDTGKISSSTWSDGKAGDVSINTGLLWIDGADTGIFAAAKLGSFGQSGEIIINATDVFVLNHGIISIATKPVVPLAQLALITPTALNINAQSLQLANGGQISAASSGNVNAGAINLAIGKSLTASSSALISSGTFGAGNAGNINIKAATINLDNAAISSEANKKSQGQTGNVEVSASSAIHLNNQAKISMQNDAVITNPEAIIPTAITVSAPDIVLKDSKVTTAATGNIDAGNINLNFSNGLMLDFGLITTAATDGDGGTINIAGGLLINLQHSALLTSVSGANGNGGLINISANALAMNSGVIQANAVSGAGGNINLTLKTLIPSENYLIKGGERVQAPYPSGLNVIQAVSETGFNGTIKLTSPQFNLSGSITGLKLNKLSLPVLGNSLCQGAASNSTLARGGKGGIALNEATTGFIPMAAASISKSVADKMDDLLKKEFINHAAVKQDYPCAAVSLTSAVN